MAEERTYTIPLRKELNKVPNYKRTRKATNTVRAFLLKHMKGTEVKLGKHLNELLWKNGNRNPPPRIKVKTMKDDKNIIFAELPEFEFAIKKKEDKDKKTDKKEAKENKEENLDMTLDKNIKKTAKEQSKKSAESSTAEQDKK